MSLNGIVIGAIMEIVHQDHTLLFVAAAILPHGIFEIPAFILSGALGILLAQSLIAELYGGEDTAADARRFGRLFILYVLPLVAIAAGVEAFITPVVIHLVA
jgi:stage II sporulation protein M